MFFLSWVDYIFRLYYQFLTRMFKLFVTYMRFDDIFICSAKHLHLEP